MAELATQTRDVISFGPFSLIASERRFTKDGIPLELGARTLDILIALVSRPNQAMGKRELMAEVWPDVIVGEGSLRFYVARLRKALGDGKDGARYIATLAGRGYKGELAIRQGDAKGGVESVRDCLVELHAARYELLATAFNLALIQGLAALGRFTEAIDHADEAIRQVEANGDFSSMPEFLRVKGGLLLSMPLPDGQAAEDCFMHSLELSRRQGAAAWELRTATDLAALSAARDRPGDAKATLRPVFERFVEGSETADLKAAERLLASLG